MAAFQALWTFVLSEPGQRLIQNVIAVTALVFAIRGVRNWSRERRDLRRAELAEKTLVAAYRAKDAIQFVRSPFGSVGEGATRKRDPNETTDQTQALDSAFAPIERLSRASEIFEEVQSLRYSIGAAFSLTAAKPLTVFMEVRAEIIAASHSKMRDATRDGRVTEAAIAHAEKMDAVIWEGYGEDEKIVPRLDQAIADLEKSFRPYVEATFRLAYFWPSWLTWGKKDGTS